MNSTVKACRVVTAGIKLHSYAGLEMITCSKVSTRKANVYDAYTGYSEHEEIYSHTVNFRQQNRFHLFRFCHVSFRFQYFFCQNR